MTYCHACDSYGYHREDCAEMLTEEQERHDDAYADREEERYREWARQP